MSRSGRPRRTSLITVVQAKRLSGKPRVDGRKRLKAKELCQMCVRLTQLIFLQWFAAITSPLLG